MDKLDVSKYRSVFNTHIRSLLRRSRNIYQGSIRDFSKEIGIHPILSDVYSIISEKRYPYIHQTKFKNKTIRFYVNSPPERNRVDSLKYIILDRIYENLEDDDVFFDVGAGIGTISCSIGCHLSEGMVYAFEPLPANTKAIHRNFVQNSIEGEVFQCALSDTESKMTFTIPDRSVEAGYTNAALLPEYTDSNFWEDKTEGIKVPTKNGDKLREKKEIPVPNIVAIDVEGAEMKVIEGLENTLSNNECRVVFCEVHEYLLGDFGTSSEKLEDKLRTLGFDLRRFDRREYEMDGEYKSLYRIEARK